MKLFIPLILTLVSCVRINIFTDEDSKFRAEPDLEYLIKSENNFYIGIENGEEARIRFTQFEALAVAFKIIYLNITSNLVVFELQNQPDGYHYLSSDKLDCRRQTIQSNSTHWRLVQAVPTENLSKSGTSPYYYIQSVSNITASQDDFSEDGVIIKQMLFNDILGDILSENPEEKIPDCPVLRPLDEVEDLTRFRFVPVGCDKE